MWQKRCDDTVHTYVRGVGDDDDEDGNVSVHSNTNGSANIKCQTFLHLTQCSIFSCSTAGQTQTELNHFPSLWISLKFKSVHSLGSGAFDIARSPAHTHYLYIYILHKFVYINWKFVAVLAVCSHCFMRKFIPN